MFNEMILIDRNRLEEECSEVTGFFDYWMRQESDLESDLKNHESNFKRDLRTLDAEKINKKYGLSIQRMTEGVVDTLFESDPKHQNIMGMYLDAKSQRKSYGMKIDMLKVLAQLHGQGYFAKIESSPPALDLIAKKVREKISESIRKRATEKVDKPRRPKR